MRMSAHRRVIGTAVFTRGCRANPRKSTGREVVGEITEISGDLKALSHQLAVFTPPPTVVSHALLMHQTLDRFLRQPCVTNAEEDVM